MLHTSWVQWPTNHAKTIHCSEHRFSGRHARHYSDAFEESANERMDRTLCSLGSTRRFNRVHKDAVTRMGDRFYCRYPLCLANAYYLQPNKATIGLAHRSNFDCFGRCRWPSESAF
jgi:hypothetical protein